MKRFDPLQSLGLRRREKQSDLPETSGENLYSPKKDKRQQSSIRRTLKEVTVSKFIECYCNNNLSVLVIEGIPDVSELQQAWQDILLDYANTAKNDNSEALLKISVKMTKIKTELMYIDACIQLLRLKYDADAINVLYKLTFKKIASGFDNKEQYHAELDKMESIAKRKLDDYEESERDYNRLVKTVEGTKQTEDDFIMLCARLSQYIGFRIDRHTFFMDEFLGVFNLYIKDTSANK